MSHHLTNLTWTIERRGMQKIVLLCLAHLSLKSSCECSVSVRKLAFMCGMSGSALRAQLTALIAAGLVDELPGNGETVYRIHVTPRETA